MSRGSYPEYGFSSGGPVTPQIVQAYVSTTNPSGIITENGNNYEVPTPQACLAGNCLVLAFSHPNNESVSSVTSSNGNSFSLAASVTAGSGAGAIAVYVAADCNAGLELPEVVLSGGADSVTFRLIEICGIALSSPVNGTTSQAAQTPGPSVNAGSFTPTTNNDANGGNFILSFFDLALLVASANPTSFVPGGSFSLLEADIAWSSGQGFPKSSAYWLQATQASVTPSMTINGSTNAFNCLAVALKCANAGTAPPSTIHIRKITQFANDESGTTWKLQTPMLGNLRVAMCDGDTAFLDITSIVDSEGNTWFEVGTGSTVPQCFYWPNASANPNLTLTLNLGANPGGQAIQLRVFDISGAKSSQPGATGFTTLFTPSGTNITNTPVITPQATGSLVLAVLSNGLGPTTSVNAPPGAIWANMTYSGETDSGAFNFGDGHAHTFTSSTSAEDWGWTIATVQEVYAMAVEFLSN